MKPTIADRLSELGVSIPRIMLPRRGIDLYRWAVIACDQHTSEPDYWEEVSDIVGDRPSTLHLVYPEVYLGDEDEEARVARIHEAMRAYVDDGVVVESAPQMVLTRRSTPHVSERRGLMLAIDLDQYDYRPGAKSLIRATEQTILDRIPPRVKIREGAPLEVPHVMVLIDDPHDELFSGLLGRELPAAYATQLMLGGGDVAGYSVTGSALEHVVETLEKLLGKSTARNPFLFAVGDGNHSLATAKEVWERMKSRGEADDDHPARFALVEVVNLYDPGLRFEPIHRLVRTESPLRWVDSLAEGLGGTRTPCSSQELREQVRHAASAVGYVTADECGVLSLGNTRELPVTTVQATIDRHDGLDVDYIHGWDTSLQLGRKAGSVAVLLPDFNPRLLYPTVSRRGVLPRKAFSLGEAEEKRYYLEARRIS